MKNKIFIVINTQMIIDVEIVSGANEPNLISISKAVMNRLVDGVTLGIALLPLGEIEASFYSVSEEDNKYHPKLDFNISN